MHPRSSRFFDLIEFGGPMYNVFTPEDIDVVLDWVESLADRSACVEPIETGPAPQDPGARMQQVIEALAPRAKGAHSEITLAVDGAVVALTDLLDRPVELMVALVANGWIVTAAPSRSMFLSRIATNGGPMDGVLDAGQLAIVREWIEAGAPAPAPAAPRAAPRLVAARAAPGGNGDSALSWRRPYIGQGGVH
ncbi:MAG: hypothetical protein WKF96_11890 [Solirubrobacteraceae bacterium]